MSRTNRFSGTRVWWLREAAQCCGYRLLHRDRLAGRTASAYCGVMPDLAAILPKLRLEANREIWAAWHGAGLHHGTPSEVRCLKNLINVAIPKLGATFDRNLKRFGVRVQLQAVLCHGRPWVSYPGAPARCELGDFLLVHDHESLVGPLRRRAVIVQAKVFHKNGVRAKNSVQLELYQRWPRFTYVDWPGGLGVLASVHARAGLAACPSLVERELSITVGRRPGSNALLDEGSRYGMIDVEHSRWGDPKEGMNPWRLCSAQADNVYTSKDGLTLGSYLVHLIAAKVGRPVPVMNWPSSLSAACHWSLMVTDLLSLLENSSVSSSHNIQPVRQNRKLNFGVDSSFAPASTASDGFDDGSFGLIRVQTSGDIGEWRRET